jgi:hypothetical protein
MQALVVSNCTTSAYVRGLRALLPGWTVAGAALPTLEAWSRRPETGEYRAFVEFAEAADVLVALDGPGIGPPLVPCRPSALRVSIPPFVFRGLYPDAFHLQGRASVLGSGNLFSRIAVVSHALGGSPERTVALFRPEVYERLGYVALYEHEREEVIRKFAASSIDLSDAFSRWESRGKFLYTLNHPRAFVLFDILCRALAPHALIRDDPGALAATAESLIDDLAESMVWPVYQGVGDRLGIHEPLVWRTGRARGFEALDLETFVGRTFSLLRSEPVQPASVPGFDLCAEVLAASGAADG